MPWWYFDFASEVDVTLHELSDMLPDGWDLEVKDDSAGRGNYYRASAAVEGEELILTSRQFQNLLARVWFAESGIDDPMKSRMKTRRKRPNNR